jgi:hypothetical protein
MMPWICAVVPTFGTSTGTGPGLGGATNGMAKRVAYTTGEMVNAKCPSWPSPSLEWMEAALELRRRVTSVMDSYVGSPSMGGMMGWGKLSMKDLTEVAAMLV